MCGAVAQQVERVRVFVICGDDFDRAVAVDQPHEIANLGAVDLDADRALCETWTDGCRDLMTGHGVLKLKDFAVWKGYAWHGR